ncbi:MAG: hypothetical protein K9J06_05495 [Flavobacteriales bacterium]|nr:hypothetical protein [Flavobacteriales bacterium]
MRVLFLAPVNSVFVQGLAKNIKNSCPEWQLEILSIQKPENQSVEKHFDAIYCPHMFTGVVKIFNLFAVFMCFLRTAGDYDIVNIQFNRYLYVLCAVYTKLKGKKLIVSYWGSDFMRMNRYHRPFVQLINRNADEFTVTSEDSLPLLKDLFSLNKDKVRVVRFGLEALDHVSRLYPHDQDTVKQKLHLGSYSYIVALGYNGDVAQQHEKMIDAMIAIREKLPANYLILLPFTYKIEAGYRATIERKLLDSSLTYKFLDNFLQPDQMAEYWYAVDMFVHMQTTDQLSGSMFENIACGNVVIAGSWLNYSVLDVNDVYLMYSNFEDLGDSVLEGFKVGPKNNGRLQRNRSYVLNNYTWSSQVEDWIALFV